MCKTSRLAVLTVVLVATVLLSAVPALADPRSSGVAAKISLEEAIGIAKEAFPVPPEFKQFKSDYYAGNEGAVWNLHWSADGPPSGSLYVTVSADDSEILNMHFYQDPYPGGRYKGLPKYSREAARAIAEQTVRKLQPERFKETRLSPETPDRYGPVPIPLTRDYPVTYYYRFQRLSDGIPVADNGITVEVNADTGRVQYFSVSWGRDLKLPPTAGRMGADRARQVFERDALELVYVYTGPRDRDSGERPYPVYRLREGGFLLDALTGEMVDLEEGYWFPGGGDAGMGEDQKKIPDLTPSEAAAVEETKGLLSAEAARRAAEAAYSLPAGLALNRSVLTYNWNSPGDKVWELHYTDDKNEVTAGLAVDARTGEFLRFSIYRPMDKMDHLRTPEVRVSEEAARQKAQALIERLQPGKAAEVTLHRSRRDIGPWAEPGEPLPRAYTFEFARVVHGLPYPDNGFSVTVDSTTGEVTSYSLMWWNAVFPRPAGLLDRAAASDVFLKRCPLILEYTRLYPRWVRESKEPEYRLVYRPDGRTDLMVNARSGRLLDRRGEPFVDRAVNFTDIAGHPAEREILLLAEAGIVAGDGGRFRPNDRVTNAELLSMLVNAYGGDRYPPQPLRAGTPWYEPAIERALALGILDARDQYNPTAAATRLGAARLLVNAQGYGPLARLHTLFRLEAADAVSVPAADRGYVAAAVGLGLLPLDGGHFRPAGALTRGEAAQVLVRALTPNR